MNVRQLRSALENYPPEAEVFIFVTTGDGAHTLLDTEILVDASLRNGMTGRIQTHRVGIRTQQIRTAIHPARSAT